MLDARFSFWLDVGHNQFFFDLGIGCSCVIEEHSFSSLSLGMTLSDFADLVGIFFSEFISFFDHFLEHLAHLLLFLGYLRH